MRMLKRLFGTPAMTPTERDLLDTIRCANVSRRSLGRSRTRSGNGNGSTAVVTRRRSSRCGQSRNV